MVFTSPDRNRGFASSRSLPWFVFRFAIVLLAAVAPAAGQSIFGGCLYSLDPSANQAFFITGSTSISAGCSVVVESSSSSAFKIGGTETLNLGNHAKVGVVGGSQIHAGSIMDTMSNQQVQPVAIASPGDPLASVAAPTQGTIMSPAPVNYDMNHPPANDTLSPGVYCGGVTFGNPNGATFTMAPGTYIMAGGGFRLGSQANVSGSGVTIYNTSSAGWGCSGTYPYSPIDMEGQAKINLSAPTSGPLAGILFFGDRNGCGSLGKCTDQINGGTSATFAGNLYFPGDELLISGSGSIGGCMGVVADTISINGNSNFSIQACSIVPIGVTVAPQPPIGIYANQQQQFTATVTNTYNTAVTWSISPAIGSIDASGVYTAPSSISAQQTVTVTATSQANPNESGTTTLTLFPPVTVAVAPPSALLYQWQTQQFSAAVSNAFNTAVTWSVNPAGAGSVDGAGLYTAPAAITTQQTVTVTATSVVDPTKSASTLITLMPPIKVTVAPSSARLYGGQTQQFTATVINTSNIAVTWSVSPANAGTINSGGLYTAPAVLSAQESVTVTATSQADPTKSASSMITVKPPVHIDVNPPKAYLYAGRSQAFAATVSGSSNTGVVWSLSPAGSGTIDANGIYTAPATVPAQQTVTVTATSEVDPLSSASAAVVLEPPVSISISPGTATLQAGQTQGFTAPVANTDDTAVNWSISPAGTGTISATGLYSAPSSLSTPQKITVTATSEADPSKSAAATLALVPPCAQNGYSYERSIVIDHTRVQGADLTDFPVLVSLKDPLLATSANGGHVQNQNGFDIVFSSDPSGQNLLDFEIDNYNPVTGAGAFWIRIPTLSHITDTTIYMWYGNSAVAASHENKAGVWRNGYAGVWHFGPSGALSTADSTVNANNGANHNVGSAAGLIGGAGSFDGTGNTYIDIPSSNSYKPASTITLEAWVDLAGPTNWPDIFSLDYRANGSWYAPYQAYALQFESSTLLPRLDLAISGTPTPATATNNIPTGQWTHIAGTYNGANLIVYANGVEVATLAQTAPISYGTSQDLNIGTRSPYTSAEALHGLIDEARISTVARSPEWIATEYNNQSSPSTFYSISAENSVAISPGIASLAASQSQQFAAIPFQDCAAAVTWSANPAGVGTLTSSGLYTTPGSITSAQTVTITATSQVNPAQSGSAVVHLMAANQPSATLTLAASAASPYALGSSQGFVATLKDQNGNAESGVPVTFFVTGANANSGSATTDTNGIASYSYIGSNAGDDAVQAYASVGSASISSNSISVSWAAQAAGTSQGTVTLAEEPQLGLVGLVGAFTDSNGTVVEPLQIGKNPRVFVVPQGATQLQLGVDDDRFGDNYGSGFVVDVNGKKVTIPPATMPWTWVSGGQNYTYRFGIQDGTSPVVAATGLTPGSTVSIVYQSGTVNAGCCTWPYVDASGDQQFITGTISGSTGTKFPTVYVLSPNYPVGQPFQIAAMVKSGSGTPLTNVPVTLTISGANPRQIDTTTDSRGSATFTYTGTTPGSDTLMAVAHITDETDLASNGFGVTWSGFNTLPPEGSLTLTPSTLQPLPEYGQQTFTVYAVDSSGTPVAGVNVELVVSGVDNLDLNATTDSTGHANFVYPDQNPGNASVVAIADIDGMVIYSNAVTVPWTQPPTTTKGTGSGTGSGASLTVSISAPATVTLPSNVNLSGTGTDSGLPQGDTIAYSWTEVSGPGTVSFGNTQQASTTASFTQAGSYDLELTATDVNGSASAQVTININPPVGVSQGWIGEPAYGATVSGLVPITVAPGETLTSGVLTVYPADNPKAITVLNADTTGSGQIGLWDTTQVKNGTYWLTLQGTDSNGNSEYNLALLVVTGNYKPGRVTSTVTDLVVPANGLPIKIERTYDSLNAGTSGDFGYGWNLGINVDLSVAPSGDVTFTLGGKRRTFHFTPESLAPFLPGLYLPGFTPEPGLHGTLTESSFGCSALDFLVPDGSLWFCVGGGQYNPPGYVYTDPSGTAYLISAQGKLQAMEDKNGNELNITANGITSTTGLSVPFVRDSQGRITSITDPQGNVYQYSYDQSGNLASVTYPTLSTPTTYTYDSNHMYVSGTDMNGNALPSVGYYGPGDTDPNGLPLNNRLKSVTDALGETTSYAYDLSTNTTTITYPPDATGNVGKATMVYSAVGDLLSSTNPLGQTTKSTYDANRNLVSVTDPMGNVTSYTYDANGNRTSVTYPQTGTSTNTTSTTTYNQYSEPTQTTDELGNLRTFNYDANFNPQSVTDSLGTLMSTAFNSNGTMQLGAIGYDISAQPTAASKFTYDADGNLSSKTDALGRTTSYTYDTLGHKITMTEPVPSGSSAAAATTTYQYDAFGNLTQTSAPLGRMTSATYDGNGNRLSDTDARGNTTKYQYDALNRLVLTTYPDGSTANKSYDFRGNVVKATDQGGHTTCYQYDLAGRETSVTQACGTSSATSVSYTYDADGRKLTETDALGHTTSYTYDNAGNLLSVSGSQGNFQYGYDDARNRISMTDGNGNTTKYVYDARKRLVETDYPDGTKKTNAYDGPGNLASVTDQAGNVVQYTYDAANQLQSVIQASSPNTSANTTVFGYDADGNPITLEDANLHTTTSSFDLLGEPTAKTLPDGSLTETRQYDANGNLVSLTHFNGVTTTYTYDNLNRLLSRTTPGEAPVSFTYTPTGKYATSTDASGTTTYTYDSMDRLTSKETPEGTLNYTYDAAGHVASIASSNANGASMAYTYDSLNRLSTVTDNRTGGVTNYSYDAASNVATVTYPNSVQTLFHYDALNRVLGATTQQTGYIYQRDAAGNLTSVMDANGRTVNWSYDGIYRLTGETISLDPAKHNGSVGYGLDPVGNRLSETSTLTGISSGSFTYNADDELASETYDQNGNVLTSGGKTFSYDAENHLVAMNGGAVQMVYDAFGNRVAKSAGGVTTRYLVEDDVNPTGFPQVFDELTNGVVSRTYTYGLQRISETQALNNTWTNSYYGYDGMESVRQLINAAGTITDTYDYDAFGNLVNSTGTTPNNYLYRGEQFDQDLGLYYLRARYMNPLTGKFMSRDPLDGYIDEPATLHKYLYTGGDPVNWIDPLGQEDLMEYKLLRKVIKGTGLQAHHLIEKRFLFLLDFAGCELSMAVTPDEHQVITNAWRAAIPYGPNGTYCATAAQVLSTAQAIYSDEIMAAILASLPD